MAAINCFLYTQTNAITKGITHGLTMRHTEKKDAQKALKDNAVLLNEWQKDRLFQTET